MKGGNMTAKYYGKKIVKDELGHVISTKYQPCVTILCKPKEEDAFYSVVRQIEETTGIDASCFKDFDYLSADFPVGGPDEKEDLLDAYRCAKKNLKGKKHGGSYSEEKTVIPSQKGVKQ